jgi:hypothetical protein
VEKNLKIFMSNTVLPWISQFSRWLSYKTDKRI